jgi:hypothetical protein
MFRTAIRSVRMLFHMPIQIIRVTSILRSRLQGGNIGRGIASRLKKSMVYNVDISRKAFGDQDTIL